MLTNAGTEVDTESFFKYTNDYPKTSAGRCRESDKLLKRESFTTPSSLIWRIKKITIITARILYSF